MLSKHQQTYTNIWRSNMPTVHVQTLSRPSCQFIHLIETVSVVSLAVFCQIFAKILENAENADVQQRLCSRTDVSVEALICFSLHQCRNLCFQSYRSQICRYYCSYIIILSPRYLSSELNVLLLLLLLVVVVVLINNIITYISVSIISQSIYVSSLPHFSPLIDKGWCML